LAGERCHEYSIIIIIYLCYIMGPSLPIGSIGVINGGVGVSPLAADTVDTIIGSIVIVIIIIHTANTDH
jgi:hypothetical protein